MKLRITKQTDGWWIEGMPDGFLPAGPYATRGEATEGRAGIERFFAREWREPAVTDPATRPPAAPPPVPQHRAQAATTVQRELFA